MQGFDVISSLDSGRMSGPVRVLVTPSGSYTPSLQGGVGMSAHSTPTGLAPQSEPEYRLVPHFSDYRVGADGSVWSSRSYHGLSGWRRLRPRKAGKGYWIVTLHADAARRSVYIHHLVLEVFVGPRPDGMEACHADGDRTNNALRNLRWDTPVANAADKLRHGTELFGESRPWAKYTEVQIREIRRLGAEGMPSREIALLLGMSAGYVRRILSRKRWPHVE